MGCGKSKHDVVASGNAVLKRKKSSVKHNKDQEIGAQTKDDDNNNVNVNNVNVNSAEEVQKDGDNNVKEVIVGGKVDDVVDSNNGVKRSKTENASMVEETLLQKNDDIIVAGGNANVGEEKVLEKSEVVVSGGDNKAERSNGENAKEGEEKVVEKREEEVVDVVADKVESKTEKTDVKEEVKEEEKKDKEVDAEEGLVAQEVSEKKSQGEEDDDALNLNENDPKVNDAPVAEENKNGDGKGTSIWCSAKL